MNNTNTTSTEYKAGVRVIAEECIAVRLRMLNRVVSNLYDDALRPIGMTVGQLNILVMVERRKGSNQSEIGRALQMERSTLSRNLDRMRTRNWIDVNEEAGKKNHSLYVTQTGRQILLEALPLWQSAQNRAREIMDQEDKAMLPAVSRNKLK